MFDPPTVQGGIEEELGFDPSQLTPLFGGEDGPQVDRLPPGWWFPLPSIPEASRLPEHWLGWLLTTREPGVKPPMQIWRDWHDRARIPLGMRLFWSPLRACWGDVETPGRRSPCPPGNKGKFLVGWVLIPDPPLYGAHRLEGFPPEQKAKDAKRKGHVMQPANLRWVPWEGGEEKAGRGRKRMHKVWPNVVTFDTSQNRIVAIPYHSMVADGDDESMLEGVPTYPFAPDLGVNIIDPTRLTMWLPTDPMQNGAILSATIERGSQDERGLIASLDDAASIGDRDRVLRDRLGLGRQATLAVLKDPSGYRMLVAQYPDPIRFAEPGRPETRIQRIIRLLRLVLLRALPALDQEDIDREQSELERGFKIAVVQGVLQVPGKQGLKVTNWWTGPAEAAGNQRRFLSLLIHTEAQADDALRLLSRGWGRQGLEAAAERARQPDGFDPALEALALWRGQGSSAGPYYRARLVDWMKSGLDPDALRVAWGIDRSTGSTGGQWMLALAAALLLQHLPVTASGRD